MLDALAQNAVGSPGVVGNAGSGATAATRGVPSAASVARFNAALLPGSPEDAGVAVSRADSVGAMASSSISALSGTVGITGVTPHGVALIGMLDGSGAPVAAVRDGAALVDGQPLASLAALPPSTAGGKLAADVHGALRDVSQSWREVTQRVSQGVGADGDMSLAALTRMQMTTLGAMFQIDLATKIITKPPQIIDQLVKTQ